jgi:hypothetical protein
MQAGREMGNINNATLPRFICLATTSLQATEHSAFRLFFSFPFIPTKPARFAELAHLIMVQKSKIGYGLIGEHCASIEALGFCICDGVLFLILHRTLAMGFSFDYYGKDDEWDRT